MNRLAILCLALTVGVLELSARANQLYSHGDPTPEEQQMLEMANRARANPTEEGIRLMDTDDARVQGAYSYFKINKTATKAAFTAYPQRPPLAFHPDLITAARNHSKDMDANNFQGHTSSNGDDLSKRYAKVGYASQGMYGENVAAYSESVWHGHCGLNVDWGEQNQIDLGHRENIMNFKSAVYTEIGVGILYNGKGLMQGYVGPYVVTQTFGTRSLRYITGVVYADKNNNGFYDIGEGLEGVTIKPSRGSYYAVSSTSGGYAIPFSGSGSVTVTASGGNLSAPVTKTIDFTGENTKVDFIPASAGPGAVALQTPANNATGRTQELALTWGKASLADSYQWQVATMQSFAANSIVDSGTVAGTTATANVPACNTKYYWRVRSTNSVGPGAWSSVFAFTTGGKNPASCSGISPKGAVTAPNTSGVSFSWSASADATTYHLRVKSGVSPFKVVFEDSTVTVTSASVPTSSIGADGSYTWEVRGVNTCGRGGWSTPQAFQLTITSVEDENVAGWNAIVSPNPIAEASTCSITSPVGGRVRLSIVDMLGRYTEIGSFDVVPGEARLPLALPYGSAAGSYIIIVESGSQVVCRTRVVVQP